MGIVFRAEGTAFAKDAEQKKLSLIVKERN